MTIAVSVVSPERILWSGDASMVLCRTTGGGEIAFLTGHAPFMGALDIGRVLIRSEEGDEIIAVHGGFVEVSNNTVTILSDIAELASQIDVERARELAAWAEQHLKAEEDAAAEAALRRAQVRIEIATA